MATYDALRMSVKQQQARRLVLLRGTYLPHAADDTSGNEHVFHDCLRRLRCGWGRGERKEPHRRRKENYT